MNLRKFSNLMYVAELRHIQCINETTELQNPDTLVRHFLPTLRRWRCAWLGEGDITKLRADPFYYYLAARTRYYDTLLVDAISNNVEYVINIGCGSDTRAYRFEHLFNQKGIKVLECDQQEAISRKERKAKRLGAFDHISYLPLDLNDDVWPDFEHWLSKNSAGKAMVLMEGVSPYINAETFGWFLENLATKLPAGSLIAYDFKLRGVKDDFGYDDRVQTPFRLSSEKEEVASYHEERGYRLNHLELSSDLSVRLLPDLANSDFPLFMEDGLVQLEVAYSREAT